MSILSQLKKELKQRFDFAYQGARWRYEKRALAHFLQSCPLKWQPKFSIVIPTYNIPILYLQECVESIQNQSYTNWEICFCDDADPLSECTNYLRQLSQKFPNQIKLQIHEKNQGICAATKTALTLVTGDYVLFVDADDRLHSKALQCLAHAIDDSTVDFLYTNHDYMTDWGLRVHPVIKPGWSPELLMHVNYINHLTCIKKSLIDRHGHLYFQEYSTGAQDWDLCLQMIHHAEKIRHVPLILYHWRARPGSMADQPAAKPWAVQNQLEVRRVFAKTLGPHLEFNTQTWSYQTSSSTEIRYFSFNKLSNVQSLLNEIKKNTEVQNGNCIYIFHSDQNSALELKDLTTYAQLTHVGCVWPFSDSGRTAYTLHEGDQLVPILGHRSSFSSYTGNVLTGPLNGLAIEKIKLNNILQWMDTHLTSPEWTSILSSKDPNVLGAVFGLVAQMLNFRNMSCVNVRYSQELSPVDLAPSLLPGVDCYV